MSLYHPDDARWFLNCDETQHKLSNAPNKGGPTTNTWVNNSFPRSGERITESSPHITGMYTVNLAGEPLPPLFIFDTAAKNEENYSVDIDSIEGLPTVTGKYGFDEVKCLSSFVSVRKKGSMDTDLWAEYNETIVMGCYLKMSKEVVRCPLTNKILSGPVVLKTDSGPGRLANVCKRVGSSGRIVTNGV